MRCRIARRAPRRFLVAGLALILGGLAQLSASAAPPTADDVHDLSLLVSPGLPCVWPVGMTQHVVLASRTFGRSAYHRDLIIIDEHTGTQFDAPAHFVPPPDSGLPGAGPTGAITGDKVPVYQFVGEACVIDVRAHVDDAARGASYLITEQVVQEWEQAHHKLGPGDVVLFRSDYSDRYYVPLPEGERFVHTALRSETPGWPGPTPQCMRYLGERGVLALGIDSASMGPLPELAAATHQAGGQYGMVWVECATNLGSLPTTGAFYALLPAKHAGGSGGESRALAITQPELAARLIDSARAQRVVDLSVTLDEELPITWPGAAAGDEASRYIAKTLNAFSPNRGPYFARTHMLDAQAGTHVVPPSFALPPPEFDDADYLPEIAQVLSDYNRQWGPRGHSTETVEQIPLQQLMGEARVIDVRSLIGTTSEADWPASPQITLDQVQAYEQATRPLAEGDVVLFYSGYCEAHLAPLPPTPGVDRLFAAPLAGKAEGWPAPTPEVIVYLAERGIRCVGTDGPTLGGANPEQALQVYWAAADRQVYPVEYLLNLDDVPADGAFFLFAPIKIAGSHGGYGRAIALY